VSQGLYPYPLESLVCHPWSRDEAISMHAQIDRQKDAVPETHSSCCNSGKLALVAILDRITSKLSQLSTLASRLLLMTNGLKIGPWKIWMSCPRGLRTSWDQWVCPSDSTNIIYYYITQNVHPGQCCTGLEWFPRIWSETPFRTPNVPPQEEHTISLSVVHWEIHSS